jgi:hypothetical protein
MPLVSYWHKADIPTRSSNVFAAQPEALAHELREFFRRLQRPWPELTRGRRCDRKAAHIVACDQLGDQPG